MSQDASPTPTVLIVDDEQDIADLYAYRLDDHYTVRTAYEGQAAIETIDDAVDVVLLDRRMSGLSGDGVLARIREDGYTGRVIMVTAIDPDLDIIEMPFDDYLCKPIDTETLTEAIDQQLIATSYDETLRELFRATSKLSVLESEKTPKELAASEEYTRLKNETAAVREEAAELIGELDSFEAAFKAIDRSTD